jgi:hypothetical protein
MDPLQPTLTGGEPQLFMLKFMNERTHTASIDRNNFYFNGVAKNIIKLTTPGGEARSSTGRIFF